MKKFFILLGLISILFFACKKRPSDIEITFLGPTDIYIGGKAELSIILKPDIINEGKIEKLTVKDDNDNVILDTLLNSEQTVAVPLTFSVPQNLTEGSTYTITAEATEANTGHTTTETKTFDVKKSNATVYMDIYNYYDNTVVPGDVIEFDISLYVNNDGNAPAELGTFTVKDNSGIVYKKNLYGYYDHFYYDYTVPDDAEIGSTITLIFEATEKYSGNITADTFYFEVNYDLYSDYNSLYFNGSTLYEQMMMYFDYGYIHTTDGTSSYGDIAFVWDDTYGYSLVSPDAPWIISVFNENNVDYDTTNKRTTLLAPYTGNTSWDQISANTIYNFTINPTTVSGGGYGIQNLQEGDIIMFKTQNNVKGAIYISYLGEDNGSKTLYLEAKFINLPQ